MRRARWARRRRLLLAAVAVAAAVIGLVVHASGLLHKTELQTVDTRFQVRGWQPHLLSRFLLVAIDSQTLSHFTRQFRDSTEYPSPAEWPFPRREEARVIYALKAAGARVIGVDIQYTQPTDPTDDDALVSAITRAGHVVLATDEVGEHGSTDVLGGDANLRRFGHARAANSTIVADSDGVIRNLQYSYQGLVTFPVAVAETDLHRPLLAREFGGPTTPVPINFAGPAHTVPTLSFWRVYDHRFNPASVRGKIVLIGATSPVLGDVHATASSGSELMPGTEVIANETATVLDGLPLTRAPGWVNVLMILLLAAIPPLLGVRGWALRALAAALGVGFAYLVAAQLAFNSGTIIAIVDPELALVLGTIGTLVVVYLGEAFERQYARTTFARFVPPDVVDQVLATIDSDLRLAGVERVCTVMFSDLRGFTQFSEAQPVDQVIAVVNHYLNEMSEAILAAGGTLISYMGDGIMAVFGAPIEQPDHADRALRAAQEMVGPRLDAFNAWLESQGHTAGLRMGVGLNTGPVMCGNVGAEQRVEYTAIGDTTNTASRLEGMTKETPHMLFVAESTKDALTGSDPGLEFVEEFQIRGRERKLRVWTVG